MFSILPDSTDIVRPVYALCTDMYGRKKVWQTGNKTKSFNYVLYAKGRCACLARFTFQRFQTLRSPALSRDAYWLQLPDTDTAFGGRVEAELRRTLIENDQYAVKTPFNTSVYNVNQHIKLIRSVKI